MKITSEKQCQEAISAINDFRKKAKEAVKKSPFESLPPKLQKKIRHAADQVIKEIRNDWKKAWKKAKKK